MDPESPVRISLRASLEFSLELSRRQILLASYALNSCCFTAGLLARGQQNIQLLGDKGQYLCLLGLMMWWQYPVRWVSDIK